MTGCACCVMLCIKGLFFFLSISYNGVMVNGTWNPYLMVNSWVFIGMPIDFKEERDWHMTDYMWLLCTYFVVFFLHWYFTENMKWTLVVSKANTIVPMEFRWFSNQKYSNNKMLNMSISSSSISHVPQFTMNCYMLWLLCLILLEPVLFMEKSWNLRKIFRNLTIRWWQMIMIII